MKLVELTVKDFVDVLGSDAPAPGGGSAAALAAAMGISLTKMVCELTIGKKKYAEFEEDMKLVFDESKALQKHLLDAIDEDTEAFNAVSAVFDMPKETDNEKAARRAAMQTALQGAAESPFHMMKLMVNAGQQKGAHQSAEPPGEPCRRPPGRAEGRGAQRDRAPVAHPREPPPGPHRHRRGAQPLPA